jgi:hypothetical protein
MELPFQYETTAMATSMTDKLFPLPLTPFEFYYFCDNQPEYPTMYPVEMKFSGVLQRGAFSRALAAALERHPLLGSLVGEGPEGQPAWIGNGPNPVTIDWESEKTPLSHAQGEYIDLCRWPGLRVWVRCSEKTSRAVFQMHHACCDGLGALRFAEDLLVLYSREVAGGDPAIAPRPIDVTQLRTRGEFPPTEGGLKILARDAYVTARVWGPILLRTPAPLRVPSSGQNSPATPMPFLGFQTHVLDPGLTRRLRALAGTQNVTLNDLMLCDLFQTVGDWNRQFGQRGNPWLRINVPVTVRDRDDDTMPAANLLSFMFLARKVRQCRDRAGLLAGIHWETEAIKRWRLGWYFLGGLALGRRWVPWFLRRNRSFATVVLSNLGRIFSRAPLPRQGRQLVCGDVILKRITGVPPVRPLTRAAIAVVSYAEETTINLRSDPRLFTVEQSQQFLADYVARLGATVRRGK